jgi:ribonuclease P protein component
LITVLAKQYSLSKSERLKSKTHIERLFSTGKVFTLYPYRILYAFQDNIRGASVKIMISVPAKKIKRAVHRNTIKRRIREAYRLNKDPLRNKFIDAGKRLNFAILYIGDDLNPDYTYLEKKLIPCLKRLMDTQGTINSH